jgi:hypothetical protein
MGHDSCDYVAKQKMKFQYVKTRETTAALAIAVALLVENHQLKNNGEGMSETDIDDYMDKMMQVMCEGYDKWQRSMN